MRPYVKLLWPLVHFEVFLSLRHHLSPSVSQTACCVCLQNSANGLRGNLYDNSSPWVTHWWYQQALIDLKILSSYSWASSEWVLINKFKINYRLQMFYQTWTACRLPKKCRFCTWWPWPLTLSEGPNTSFALIWHKSVQPFPRYFIRNQKSHRQCQKPNLTQFTACGLCVVIMSGTEDWGRLRKLSVFGREQRAMLASELEKNSESFSPPEPHRALRSPPATVRVLLIVTR